MVCFPKLLLLKIAILFSEYRNIENSRADSTVKISAINFIGYSAEQLSIYQFLQLATNRQLRTPVYNDWIFTMKDQQNAWENLIGHVTLAAITGTTILVRNVKSYHYFLSYTFGFLWLSGSVSANRLLPGCVRHWTFSLNIGLDMFPSDSFMPCLHSLQGYSTGEFQTFQLIVFAAFGAVDQPLAPCMLVHILEI